MRISDWSSDVCSSDLIDSWLIRVPLLPRAAEFQWTSCPRAVADGWRAIWYRWLPRLRGSESRRTSAGGAPHEHDRSSRLFLASGGAGTPPRRCRRRLYRTPRAPRDGTLLRRSRARGATGRMARPERFDRIEPACGERRGQRPERRIAAGADRKSPRLHYSP